MTTAFLLLGIGCSMVGIFAPKPGWFFVAAVCFYLAAIAATPRRH